MRGKLDERGDDLPESGLIPAYAGKTAGISAIVIWWRAHPRVCGENAMLAAGAGLKNGSSPRMRGKP